MNEKHKYENVRTHDAAPIAGSMIESLRDLGYTPETAIADIVDNAIFAKARIYGLISIGMQNNPE